MEKVFEVSIETTPERVWHAITDPELRRKYSFGVGVDSAWTPGSAYQAMTPSSTTPVFAGENLIVEPPHRLVQTFNALWSADVKREGLSRVSWEIAQVEDSCLLTVTHAQLREGANEELTGGWPMILCGLKALLETGEQRTFPGALRFTPAR